MDGTNFRGGRSYTRAAGEYVWRPDHGSIVRTGEPAATDGGLTEKLSWNGPDGAPILTEQRIWTWAAVGPSACERLDPFGGGKSAVHGSIAPWLAWSGGFTAGTFDGGTRPSGAATLVFVAAADSTDPWFVRVDGYAGVGQSLAWDAPVIAEPGVPVRRSVTVFIADGILGTEGIETLIKTQGDNS
ncbi:UNVERIFIED_ORG: hypothetical protein ABID57_002468 [Arthrobacter sp. UYEF1]